MEKLTHVELNNLSAREEYLLNKFNDIIDCLNYIMDRMKNQYPEYDERKEEDDDDCQNWE